MKKLLITSALVAAAGAASAEITWTGDAETGYRSHSDTGINTENVGNGNGLYMEAGLDASASAELDNGITASLSYGLDLDYNVESGDAVMTLDNFPTLTLESSVATFTIGDVELAYNDMVDPIKSVNPADEIDGELVADLDTNVSSFSVGISYVMGGGDNLAADGSANPYGAIDTNTYSVAASGEMAGFTVAAGLIGNNDWDDNVFGVSAGYEMSNGISARGSYESYGDMSAMGLALGYEMSNGVSLNAEIYQSDDGIDDETMGDMSDGGIMGYEVSAGFKMAGADVTAGYKDNNTDSDEDDGHAGFFADASYEVLDGLTVLAGYDSTEANILADSDSVGDLGAFYVGTTYDLGGGASILASYSNAHEIGAPEYNAGATLAVSFEF